MELWIRSKDKLVLVKVDRIRAYKGIDNWNITGNEYYIYGDNIKIYEMPNE